MNAGDSPTLTYLLSGAIVALFGLLTKQLTDAQKRADKSVDDANARTAKERERNDQMATSMIGTLERLDDNVANLYTIMDGHLRYMQERERGEGDDPPPGITPPRRRRGIGRRPG
jgi:hypothetical protein